MKRIAVRNSGSYGREAARVVIVRGGDMSAGGRRRIAGWLRRQATFLERHADQMAPRYSARWLYD